MSLNIINRDTKISKLVATLADTKSKKENGMRETLELIKVEIESTQDDLSIGYKKSIKLVQNRILSDLMEWDVSKNGKEVLKYKGSKEVKRVFNIAFTIIFRNMEIDTTVLTVSQIENLANYGTVNDVNDLISSEGNYQENAVAYLKSIKTRTVTSKTFEKKAKLA